MHSRHQGCRARPLSAFHPAENHPTRQNQQRASIPTDGNERMLRVERRPSSRVSRSRRLGDKATSCCASLSNEGTAASRMLPRPGIHFFPVSYRDEWRFEVEVTGLRKACARRVLSDSCSPPQAAGGMPRGRERPRIAGNTALCGRFREETMFGSSRRRRRTKCTQPQTLHPRGFPSS